MNSFILSPQVQPCTGLPVIQEESFHRLSSVSNLGDKGSQGEDIVGGKDDTPNDAAGVIAIAFGEEF